MLRAATRIYFAVLVLAIALDVEWDAKSEQEFIDGSVMCCGTCRSVREPLPLRVADRGVAPSWDAPVY